MIGIEGASGVLYSVRPRRCMSEYIHTPRQLETLLEELAGAPKIAVDTEFVSEGVYEPQLCLIQLATSEGIWIVDPLAVPRLEPLWMLLTDPEREFVALAAREEIRFCLRGCGRPPGRLWDPQIAGGMVGLGFPLSHTNLVKKVLDIDVHGGEAFTDWRRRPLSAPQLSYAADDVRYLLTVQEELLLRARSLPRPPGCTVPRAEWIEAECERLVQKVAGAGQDERWRVAGSAGLKRRDLAVLRELWHWREETARQRNIPVRRVLRDELLVEIAKRKPTTSADLFSLRVDKHSLGPASTGLIQAVQRGLEVPESEFPHTVRREDPPQVGVLAHLLGVLANNLAAKYQVDTTLLATSAELQDIVRWRLGVRGVEEPPALSGWRGAILRQPALDLLDGRTAIRVEDIRRRNPLAFGEPG